MSHLDVYAQFGGIMAGVVAAATALAWGMREFKRICRKFRETWRKLRRLYEALKSLLPPDDKGVDLIHILIIKI